MVILTAALGNEYSCNRPRELVKHPRCPGVMERGSVCPPVGREVRKSTMMGSNLRCDDSNDNNNNNDDDDDVAMYHLPGP